MTQASEAGITPLEFWELTLGEIIVAIEGYHAREKATLISRLNAVLRGLSTLGKKGTDPYKGLIDPEPKSNWAFENAARQVFQGPAVKAKSLVALAKERWLWHED